jgi:signal transduction histidine kinase
VTIVDPRRIGAPRAAPPVRIESAAANARPVTTDPEQQLPARTTHLQIAFTSLTLTDPERIRFRYLLEGFDDEWIDAGTSRQATYTNLPPGNYRFRVVASNNDGTSSDPGAVWAFTILPTFYQTRTFYTLCALAAALFVWVAWKVRVARVRRQFALVLAERIRMSRAIHDTLLQGLVGLALQFNDLSRDVESFPPAKEKLSRIRRQVEEYIREARSAIWDLRSPKLETRDLATALREASERAIAGTDVQFEFAVEGPPRKASSPTEEQILLIGQEAVSNAVRHGKATRIRMMLRYEPDRIGLRVADDGCGFDVDVVRRAGGAHYGLASMSERAEQVRGFFKVVSSPGTGTEIEAVVPTS